MPTRIALGTCGAVRVETDDEDLVRGFTNGIGAGIREGGEIITLYPMKKGGSHFHEYPNGKHLVSVNLPEDQRDIIPPFRIYEADEAEIEKYPDGTVDFMLAPAETRKPPKGRRGHTRNDTERRRHPLSPTDAAKDDEEYWSLPGTPRDITTLIRMTNEAAEHLGCKLCIDEDGKLYGRIG